MHFYCIADHLKGSWTRCGGDWNPVINTRISLPGTLEMHSRRVDLCCAPAATPTTFNCKGFSSHDTFITKIIKLSFLLNHVYVNNLQKLKNPVIFI